MQEICSLNDYPASIVESCAYRFDRRAIPPLLAFHPADSAGTPISGNFRCLIKENSFKKLTIDMQINLQNMLKTIFKLCNPSATYYSFKFVLVGLANGTIIPNKSDTYYFCCRRSAVLTDIDQVPGFVKQIEDSYSETSNNITFDRAYFMNETLDRWDSIRAILEIADREKRINWAFDEFDEKLWSDNDYLHFRFKLIRQRKQFGMSVLDYPIHE